MSTLSFSNSVTSSNTLIIVHLGSNFGTYQIETDRCTGCVYQQEDGQLRGIRNEVGTGV